MLASLADEGTRLAANPPAVPPATTDWYAPAQLPTRTGVYKCRNNTHPDAVIRFRYFDGTNWYYGGETARDALRLFQTQAIIVPAQSWCGLTERAE